MNETLYQKRIPIYPHSVKGRFRNLKYIVLAIAYSVYFLLPWVRWERAGDIPDQAVLFDLPGRHFYLFGLVVQAQDMFWLASFLVIAAMLLFFVTGIAGRVFCGYFCFQTLWTDVFMLIERWVQGERAARIRLHKTPWTDPNKLLKLLATWGLWLLVAFVTGLSFTLYWADAPTLMVEMVKGTAAFPAYATTFFLTATTFVMAGLAREQACTYMCPYARFQSVMFDKDTLIVSYDRQRGEASQGRSKLRKEMKAREERQSAGVGDCIDCGFCVQVCPTGIDIRHGLQLSCIHCALCIDACDQIMDSLKWPRGLIRYSSENELSGGKTRIIKPKTIGYGIVLSIAIIALGWSIAQQSEFNASIEQVRQPLFVVMSNGQIQNSYEIKLNNKSIKPMRLRISMQDLPNAELDLGALPNQEIVLQPEQRLRILAKVRMNAPSQKSSEQQHFKFVITPTESDARADERPALFYLPE